MVLDPGHGGHDNGATSRYGFEKDFALDVALRAGTSSRRSITRSYDQGHRCFHWLRARAAVANDTADSTFISIHFNASSSNLDARGFEIF